MLAKLNLPEPEEVREAVLNSSGDNRLKVFLSPGLRCSSVVFSPQDTQVIRDSIYVDEKRQLVEGLVIWDEQEPRAVIVHSRAERWNDSLFRREPLKMLGYRDDFNFIRVSDLDGGIFILGRTDLHPYEDRVCGCSIYDLKDGYSVALEKGSVIAGSASRMQELFPV